MAAKTIARKSTKPRAAKRAAVRAVKLITRRAARKARKPKAPKAATRKPRKPKRVTRKMLTGSFRKVWNGSKKFTKGGLTKADLMMNSRRKIVSKRAHDAAKSRKSFAGWSTAVRQARRDLGITGFVLINRGAQGVALYRLATQIYRAGTIGSTPQ